jgi:hypothetical protein
MGVIGNCEAAASFFDQSIDRGIRATQIGWLQLISVFLE